MILFIFVGTLGQITKSLISFTHLYSPLSMASLEFFQQAQSHFLIASSTQERERFVPAASTAISQSVPARGILPTSKYGEATNGCRQMSTSIQTVE